MTHPECIPGNSSRSVFLLFWAWLALPGAVGLHSDDALASAAAGEVAVAFKAADLPSFRLADYRDELIECSALAATQTLIGDDIGADAGAEVRRRLASDYWYDVSKAYLTLAEQAAGETDLYREMGIHLRELMSEWRGLTDGDAASRSWSAWFERVERCDAWRVDEPAHAYATGGRKPRTAPASAPEVAMTGD